jgi:ABC-type transporter Mla subunit MlaD
MARNRNAVRAGIFMLLSVAATIAIVLAIGGATSLTMHFQTRKISFNIADNIGGLRKGDDVRLGGFKVGSVDDIQFEKKGSQGSGNPETDSIVVSISLPQEYILATDAKVGIETTLTGACSVNISDLGNGPEVAADTILPGRPDDFTVLRAKLVDLMPKISATVDVYKRAGEVLTADIHDLAGELKIRIQKVAASAVNALDAIHDFLGPASGDFHETVANVKDITGGLKKSIPPITQKANELLTRLNEAVAKARLSLNDVATTISNTRDITASVRDVVLSNHGKFNEIIASLKKTGDNLEQTSVELRHSPWRLLYKPSPDEMANLNLYDAARQFADGADELSDAANSLRDALKEKDADPARVQKLYDDLSDKFSQFQQVEQDLWKKVQE